MISDCCLHPEVEVGQHLRVREADLGPLCANDLFFLRQMHPIARKYVSWLMYPSFCCRVLAVANSKVCHLFEETSMCVGK